MVVSFESDEEVVVAGSEAPEGKIAVLVGYGELGIGSIRFGGHADGGLAQYLFAGRVNDMPFYRSPDLSLRKGGVGKQEADEDKQRFKISHNGIDMISQTAKIAGRLLG
jgi:hypothetical protein